MKSPIHLFGLWYLVKDTTIPLDLPPRARDELVKRRVGEYDRKVNAESKH